jgi:hypothetical protein
LVQPGLGGLLSLNFSTGWTLETYTPLQPGLKPLSLPVTVPLQDTRSFAARNETIHYNKNPVLPRMTCNRFNMCCWPTHPRWRPLGAHDYNLPRQLVPYGPSLLSTRNKLFSMCYQAFFPLLDFDRQGHRCRGVLVGTIYLVEAPSTNSS